MASITMTVVCRGYVPRRVRLEHVRHLRTHTGGPGTGNVDRELYRHPRTGWEVELLVPDDARLFPASLRVGAADAARLGMRRRAESGV
jgi:hypothetical protein